MRAFVSVLVLFSLTLMAPAFVPVFAQEAQEACRCKGCGCKGGPGWRGPEGTCVSKSALAQICGTPPGAPCKQESAARVCSGKQAEAQVQ